MATTYRLQTCPVCRAPLRESELKRDRIIENIIGDLEIRCASLGSEVRLVVIDMCWAGAPV
eukprot:scaffold374_cov380-Prasinococcus_capsulatus_cf.AAC.8